MATLSLKISLEGGRVTKTIQFDPQTTIFDACKIIRDKFAEAVQGERKLIFIQSFHANIYSPQNKQISYQNYISTESHNYNNNIPKLQHPNMVYSCPMKTISKAFG